MWQNKPNSIHLGLGSTSLHACSSVAQGWCLEGEMPLMRELQAQTYTHMRSIFYQCCCLTSFCSLLLLSLFIWHQLPQIGPCVKRPILPAFSSSFLAQIKATPGSFTAFTTVFYNAVFLPSGQCQVMGMEVSTLDLG